MSNPKVPPWMQEVATAGGWEQHHITNLQKELELKKAELELFKELNKIPPEQWGTMKETMLGLRDFVQYGTSEFLQPFIDQVKTSVSSLIDLALSPLKNEINSMINSALAPILGQLSIITNNLGSFISSGPTGGAWGGLIGSVAGLFLPGGQIWMILGALIGSGIEQMLIDLNIKTLDYEEGAKDKNEGYWIWGPGGYLYVGPDTTNTGGTTEYDVILRKLFTEE